VTDSDYLVNYCDLWLKRLGKEDPKAPWIVIGVGGDPAIEDAMRRRKRFKDWFDELIKQALDVNLGSPPLTQLQVDRDWKDIRTSAAAINTGVGYVKQIREWAEAKRVAPADQPAKHRSGRPRKGERSKDDLVIAALATHHQYEPGGIIGNRTPASVKELVELSKGKDKKATFSTAAVSRFFKDGFPDRGFRGYENACAQGRIGKLLAQWQGEDPEHRHAELTDQD
jgi:hypothetical protein